VPAVGLDKGTRSPLMTSCLFFSALLSLASTSSATPWLQSGGSGSTSTSLSQEVEALAAAGWTCSRLVLGLSRLRVERLLLDELPAELPGNVPLASQSLIKQKCRRSEISHGYEDPLFLIPRGFSWPMPSSASLRTGTLFVLAVQLVRSRALHPPPTCYSPRIILNPSPFSHLN
jgi:hypothetical protein